MYVYAYAYVYACVRRRQQCLLNRNKIAFLLSLLRTVLRCIEMIRETMTDNSFMSRLLDNSKTVYELHIHLYINIFPIFTDPPFILLFVYLQIWCIAQTNRMSRFPIWPIYLSNVHRMPIGWSFINR